MKNFRPCGECDACCVWPTGNVYGHEFGCGKSCKFLSDSKENKCSIYNERPDFCKSFQCAWSQHLIPEEMRPDKCNVLVTVDISGKFLRVFPINNKEINSEVKHYLQEWSEKMNIPVVFVEPSPPISKNADIL